MKKSLLKAMIIWLLFIPVAFANGALREIVYKQFVGDLFAHQISTVIAIVVFFLLANTIVKMSFSELSFRQLLEIGFSWVMMTILFEFVIGHFISNFPWERLFADYNILQGRIWSLFLFSELLTPFLIKAYHKPPKTIQMV